MDYKYIEQLLERYWNCETSTAEEELLRTFFRQTDLPEHLMRYRDLFVYQQVCAETVALGDDFDTRLLARVERQSVKARTISWSSRLRPLYKAAAVVAILLTLGTAIQHAIQGEDSAAVADYNYATYSDTYNDPQVALEEASSALERISEGLRATMAADSLQALQQTVGTKLTE